MRGKQGPDYKGLSCLAREFVIHAEDNEKLLKVFSKTVAWFDIFCRMITLIVIWRNPWMRKFKSRIFS